MNFIKGRDDLAVTIFVPWDCQNNCKFCTSKKEYSKYLLDIKKVKESIIKLNNLGFDKFVFTGGEPFANLKSLKELIDLIDSDKTIFINTTLPKIDDLAVVNYINCEQKIKGISVSRHSEDTVKLNNICEDSIFTYIKKPIRINTLLDNNVDVMSMIDRFSIFKNVLLNLRVDYRNIKEDTLKVLDGIGTELNNNREYKMLYEGGCNVCHNFEFVRLSDGFRVQYHKGLEQSSFKIEDTVIYNDLIIKPNGQVYYDWDNKNYDIELLFKSLIENKGY